MNSDESKANEKTRAHAETSMPLKYTKLSCVHEYIANQLFIFIITSVSNSG